MLRLFPDLKLPGQATVQPQPWQDSAIFLVKIFSNISGREFCGEKKLIGRGSSPSFRLKRFLSLAVEVF